MTDIFGDPDLFMETLRTESYYGFPVKVCAEMPDDTIVLWRSGTDLGKLVRQAWIQRLTSLLLVRAYELQSTVPPLLDFRNEQGI
jgi:hypothetical protein